MRASYCSTNSTSNTLNYAKLEWLSVAQISCPNLVEYGQLIQTLERLTLAQAHTDNMLDL